MQQFSQEPQLPDSQCEIRVQVDFENHLLLPLGIAGFKPEETGCLSGQVVLYSRERCHPECRMPACCCCRTTKLYQDCAQNPKGSGLVYRPHVEYLYCLRFPRRRAMALLSLTPREQNVEVKELGLLARWFSTCFQRAQTAGDVGAKASACPAAKISKAVAEPSAPRLSLPTTMATASQQLREDQSGVNSTSKYLPNMRIIYQVRKERMTVTLPNPNQLKREIEVLLACRKDVEPKLQSVLLQPGQSQASCDLIAARDLPYTIMAKLRDQGGPVEMLDLATERKVLRVQESRQAPKHMNFLMERRVDQRATFVLHVTFDEQEIEVGNQWLGEFFLDVDTDTGNLCIGTVSGHEHKTYRVEKLIGGPGCLDNPAEAKRALLFEGGVDADTLFTREAIRIQRCTDYLISVLDPQVGGAALPTSVLSFQKTSLFVKEIKGSDVRLHVTVQRNLPATMSAHPAIAATAAAAGSGGNNENNLEATAANVISRRQADGSFHCPMGERYRIVARTGAGRYLERQQQQQQQQQQQARRQPATAPCRRQRTLSSSLSSSATAVTPAATAAATAATEAALAAADTSSYSCGGGSGGRGGCSDSGFVSGGNNQSSYSESVLEDGCSWASQATGGSALNAGASYRRQHRGRRPRAFDVNLDVNFPRLQARLMLNAAPLAATTNNNDEQEGRQRRLEPGQTEDEEADDGDSATVEDDDAAVSDFLGGCYVVVEESQIGGRPRSTPCQLGQVFNVNRWCRYTVKSVEERSVNPLFTFRLTDRDVTEVRACNSLVRLTQTVAR